MTEIDNRMTCPDHPPTDTEVAAWIGRKTFQYWQRIVQLIEERYPGVFIPEWLFGGKKHGWSFRYKKSKSFCTMIPEKSRFSLLIVFGAEERARVEAVKKSLLSSTQKKYDMATTYHDGKWLLLNIDNNRIVDDVIRLLIIKRKPKNSA